MPERTPVEMVEYLSGRLAAEHAEMRKLNRYYEGDQPLCYMAPALQQEIGDRITQLVINWPRMGVDAYENRLDVEGFRLPGKAKADDRLWGIWQANDLDEISQQAHLESLILKRSYAIVGPNEDEPELPIITVEHPSQVVTHHDPRTRKVIAGLKRWTDDDDTLWSTLYTPDVDRFFAYEGGKWILQDETVHNRGFCSVVPLVNRPRMMKPGGTSELADVIPIADAANKMATDMMISGEYHAMPRRVWFGLDENDFVDENGKPLSTWEKVAGREWATSQRKGEEADVVQFPEAALSNFHDTIKLLAQVASQMLALPPHYLQFAGTNPASADAIRSSEAQLVKRVERKQRVLGGAWEQVMRIAATIAKLDVDGVDLRRMETVWRDASTPTVAQVADAAVKKFQVGIATLRQARLDVGYTDTQIDLMEDEEREALERDPMTVFARQQEAVSAAGRAELQEAN
jgi:hypothetical protein